MNRLRSLGGPVRLLTVSSYFDTHRGGLEIVAGRLADELARLDFEVTWLASTVSPPRPHAEARTVGVTVWNGAEERMGVPFPIPGPVSALRLIKAAARADVVLIHDTLYPITILAALAAKAWGKPLVVVQHIGAIPYRSRALRGVMAGANRLVALPLLRSADRVVFISQRVQAFFTDLGLHRHSEVIFNGVDTAVFRPAEDATAQRDLMDLPSGPTVLFVGRFVEKKGLHIIEQVARSRPGITFLLAGWGHIDPRLWGLANVRVVSGVSGPSLAPLYQCADLLLLPSCGEGYPLVIQEALACGLRVVCGQDSVKADPAASALLHGVAIDTDTDASTARVTAAVDALIAQGATDSERRKRSAFASAHYAWSVASARYGRLLRDALGARARNHRSQPASVRRPA